MNNVARIDDSPYINRYNTCMNVEWKDFVKIAANPVPVSASSGRPSGYAAGAFYGGGLRRRVASPDEIQNMKEMESERERQRAFWEDVKHLGYETAVDKWHGGLKPVYPELWVADALGATQLARAGMSVAKSVLAKQLRHSPIWKARRVLSDIPIEKSKIRYGYPSVESVIPPKPGMSRVYRGSGVDAMSDLERPSVLSRPHGYDNHSKGLYGYQGWRGNYEDYWGSFPESVKSDVLRQMEGKTLVTGSPEHAALFRRGGDGGYIHVYDIPNEKFNSLRWTSDAGQQRGILEHVKKSIESGKEVGDIPVPFGRAGGSAHGETVLDKSMLRDGYSGYVHELHSYSPLRYGTWVGHPMFRRGVSHENRLGRMAGLKIQNTNTPSINPAYNMHTYYRGGGDVRTFSPVEDTLSRLRDLELRGWSPTWLDRLTEIVSPTIQK